MTSSNVVHVGSMPIMCRAYRAARIYKPESVYQCWRVIDHATGSGWRWCHNTTESEVGLCERHLKEMQSW